MTNVKNPEFILAVVNTPELSDITLDWNLTIGDLVTAIEGDLVIAQRTMLERSPQFRQIIPYILVQKRINNEDHVCVYQRTKKVGEQRLAGKNSIGFGGHIEHKDVAFAVNGSIDLTTSILNTAYTEIAEELIFIDPAGNEIGDYEIKFINMFLSDSSDEVAKVHLGILMTLELDENVTVKCREEELKFVGFYPVKGLDAVSDLDFENWSKLYLNYLNEE